MFPAFLDTNTLFGAALANLLLTLAERGIYKPFWSAGVLNELSAALCRRGIPRVSVDHRINAMQDTFIEAEVFGYEYLIPQMKCAESDRHVLAAAVQSKAAVIVTFNLRDFPEATLAPYQLIAIHPDEFLLDQLDLNPSLVAQTVIDIPEAYENPPLTVSDFCDLLQKAGVPKFVNAIRHLL